MIAKMKWNRMSGVEIQHLFSEIAEDIKRNSDSEIKFYVGTDSQPKKKITLYVTAIVLYKVGKGGSVYYSRQHEKMTDMRTRLWNETYKAVEVAKELNEFLKQHGLRVDEIHADLNPDERHNSNTAVQACLGYICGMGFNGKIKPHSWVATTVANKKTKGGRNEHVELGE